MYRTSKFRLFGLVVIASSLALLSGCAGVSSSSKSSPQSTPSPTTSASYTVDLSWNASNSLVIGYNLYRGTVSGGPYARLNSSVLSGTTYTDSTIQSGTTYYYVSTSINSDSEESSYSNEATASIP
jgi:fibronectin type 3 domain-containing protein